MSVEKKGLTCLICKNTFISTVGKLDIQNKGYHKNSKLLECYNCGFSFVYPFPEEEKVYEIYSDDYHYQKKLSLDILYGYFLNRQNLKDANFITSHIDKGKVLDIGAGRGDMLSLLDGNKWEKWAFDPYISKSDNNILRSKIGNHVNDYDKLNKYPLDSFDLIILRNVIEHTLDFNYLISSISKLLKKDGYLFIRTPNTDSVDYKILKNKWWVLNMPGHMAFFGKSSIDKLLQKYNLKTIDIIPENRSSLLSLYRSNINKDSNKTKSLINSVFYSYISKSLGEGGDMIMIAQKI